MTTKVRIENPEGPDALQISKYENNTFRPVVILERGDSFMEYAYKGVAFKVEEIPSRQPEVADVNQEVVVDDASESRTKPDNLSDVKSEELLEDVRADGFTDYFAEGGPAAADVLTPDEIDHISAAIELSDSKVDSEEAEKGDGSELEK